MNKFVKLNGHNPESKSAKERERRRKIPLLGEIKCCKCGTVNTTLYKRRIDGKETYICKTCWEIRERKGMREKFGG